MLYFNYLLNGCWSGPVECDPRWPSRSNQMATQWRIQEFPTRGGGEEGSPTPNVGLFCKLFAENCMKMKEFGSPWIRQWILTKYFGLAIIASNGNQPTEGLFCVVFWWATELQATDRSQEPIQNVSCLLLFEMAHNLFLFFLLHQIQYIYGEGNVFTGLSVLLFGGGVGSTGPLSLV